MPRVLRTAGSFAVVLVAYWAYALVAVPLIEPPADTRRDRTISDAARARAQQRVDRQVEALRGLFPAKAWQLKNPKVLESDRVKLLFQDYRNLGDGRVELQPCSIIFKPDRPADDEAQRKRQAVILEIPGRALLEFDEPFDLRRGRIGRLVAGQLAGRIRIHSKGKKPGPEDDLLIVTQNVQLTEHHVWTPHRVDFHLGPHYGRGDQLHIKLLPGEESGSSDRHGPNVAGVELFEVRHLQRLHLELGRATLAPGKKPAATENVLEASDLPVEIDCRGPFRFDVIDKVATFEDRVNVLRINPDGPSDQLNCELLSVFFTDRTEATPDRPDDAKRGSKKPPAGSFDLQPGRIEAQGDPVVVSAPSQQVHARGERLEYDLQTNRLVLDGRHEVMLQQGLNEIHARSLQYQSAGPGRLGRIAAEGPGWLCGEIAARPGEQLEARWQEQLRVRPHEQNQVISLSGDAQLKLRGVGQLDAKEIHLWLCESPPEGKTGRSRLRPDRMLARNHVRVDSPQLSGTVEQLEVWFEQLPKSEGGEREAESPLGALRHGDLPLAAHQPPTSTHPLPTSAFPLPSTAYRLSPAGRSASEPPAGQRHFEITGRLLRARVLVQGDQQTQLSELMVEDNLRFVETQTAEADQRPLLVSGDRLHVTNAGRPHAAVTVTGQPAHFEGRGLLLSGQNINLNRGTNRLWIDGAGRMQLPLDRDLENRPLRNPGILDVEWQDRMALDGRTARLEGAVVANAPNRDLRTETLEVQFKRAIQFSDDRIQQDPQVEQLLCRGGVVMQSHTSENQTRLSHERIQVVDLTINLTSGALTAGGPGWLTSVRRGAYDLLKDQTDSPPAPADAPQNARTGQTQPAGDGDGDQLRCLHVRFQGSITGNVRNREMTFHDQVHAAYAPVDSWEATLQVNNPDVLGPGSVALRCDRLTASEMETLAADRRTLEFEAAGNVVVESSTFTARAIRMTYAEAKGLLVLEGDGRTNAQLFRQQQVGSPTSKAAARKILYWPETNRLKVDGAQSLELSRFPADDAGKR